MKPDVYDKLAAQVGAYIQTHPLSIGAFLSPDEGDRKVATEQIAAILRASPEIAELVRAAREAQGCHDAVKAALAPFGGGR